MLGVHASVFRTSLTGLHKMRDCASKLNL